VRYIHAPSFELKFLSFALFQNSWRWLDFNFHFIIKMNNYFSGLVNSVKGFLGYENLEVEPGGSGEEKENNAASEDRQSLWKQVITILEATITFPRPVVAIHWKRCNIDDFSSCLDF
jgi:hypothetical protein